MLLTVQGVQAQEILPLTPLSGPIVLDGAVDEPAWDSVAPLSLTVFAPTFGAPPTERTEIRVAYDETFLYVSGRMYDSTPRQVRTNTLYRDQYSGDDVLAVIIDSFNDYETALWFSVNPAGVRTDRSIANDAEFASGRPMNPDWNAFWDAATRQTEEGWFAELRIPFSSLGFQSDGGRVVMGLIAYRFIARKNERHLFPAIPPNWGLAFAKPSQARRVSLAGVYRRTPVYVTPYVLGGLDQEAQLNAAQTAYRLDDDVSNEGGLDIRYSPTSNLTLDLTLNTDFAQVEVDDQQVNLTRFSLFLPEKRQFFQERSSTFEFNTGGFSRLFHSRRIGLDEGEPIRIYGGARLVGRVAGTDLGLLTMQTAESDELPSENFGVARLRRQVFNPYSTVGGIVTTRLSADGSYNIALGLDGVVRPFGDEYLTVKWAQTFENDGRSIGSLDATRLLARWERRNDNGFSYSADYLRSGAAFNPGIGFTIRDDFTFLQNELQYQWFLGADSPFRSIALQNRAATYLRNADGSAESRLLVPSLQMELKSGAEITLSVANTYESVVDTFLVSDGPPVLPGPYWFHEAQLQFMASRAAQLRPSVTLSAGSFYDGWRVGVQATPAWNPSRHLELGVEYQLNIIRFPDRDEALDAHLARVRVQTALDTHFSVSTFMQYNGTREEASINARFRYNFREGRDLWLVYNEVFNTNRAGNITEPSLPVTQSRVLLLKYTHTFIW